MTLFERIKYEWCRMFHVSGYIIQDPTGQLNWQCAKCGRWANPIPSGDEYAVIFTEIIDRERIRKLP